MQTRLPYASRGIDPESGKFKPKQDCNYPFPIDLAPNGSPSGAKSMGKEKFQSSWYALYIQLQTVNNYKKFPSPSSLLLLVGGFRIGKGL